MLEQGKISEILVPIYDLMPQVLGGNLHPDTAIERFNTLIGPAREFVEQHAAGWRGDYTSELRQWLKDADHVLGALCMTRLQDRHKHRAGMSVIGRAIGRLDSMAYSGEVDLQP